MGSCFRPGHRPLASGVICPGKGFGGSVTAQQQPLAYPRAGRKAEEMLGSGWLVLHRVPRGAAGTSRLLPRHPTSYVASWAGDQQLLRCVIASRSAPRQTCPRDPSVKSRTRPPLVLRARSVLSQLSPVLLKAYLVASPKADFMALATLVSTVRPIKNPGSNRDHVPRVGTAPSPSRGSPTWTRSRTVP